MNAPNVLTLPWGLDLAGRIAEARKSGAAVRVTLRGFSGPALAKDLNLDTTVAGCTWVGDSDAALLVEPEGVRNSHTPAEPKGNGIADTPAQPTLLDHALRLAAAGFDIFPVEPGQKQPPLIKNFPAKASRDPGTIRGWWARWPDANVAISATRFGDGEALVVVDVDVKKNGDASLGTLDAEGFELPATYTQTTPTGGRHLVYRVAEALRQGVDVLGPGLDIRSKGGYIVGSGSQIIKVPYIDNGLEVAPAPAWLVQRLGKAPEKAQEAAQQSPVAVDQSTAAERAREYLASAAPLAVKGQGGDQMTYKVACAVRDFGVTEAACAELMLNHWNARTTPGWTPERLAEKVAHAYTYAQQPAGHLAPEAMFEIGDSPDQPGDKKDRPGLVLRLAGDLKLSSMQPLVKGVADCGTLSLWAGAYSAGKTLNLVDVGLAIARGVPWQGHKTTPGAVLFLALEGGPGMDRRIMAYAKHHGVELCRLPAAVYSGALDLMSQTESYVDLVVRALRELEQRAGAPARLLGVDTLNRALGAGDENSNSDIGRLLANCNRIQEATGAHIGLVHHLGKDASKGARGASAIPAGVDSAFEIGDGQIVCTKQRDREQTPPRYFKVEPVALGVDSDGDPVTSAVAVPSGPTRYEAPEVDGGSAAGKALAILRELVARGGKPADGFPDIGQTGVSVKAWQSACKGKLSTGDRHADNAAFHRARKALVDIGAVKEHEGFVIPI